MILSELQKAFDTVKPRRFILKMEFIGSSQEKKQNGLNLICEIGNLKCILHTIIHIYMHTTYYILHIIYIILSQSLETSCAEFFKYPF